MIRSISPEQARALLKDGAQLVDVREADERARLHIPGSHHAPLSALNAGRTTRIEGEPKALIVHCRSGMRTQANAGTISGLGNCEILMIEGGLQAWQAAGFEVAQDRKAPLEIMRQVQIVAGLLVLAGVGLGFALHPGFFGLSAFVGAGLTFAGVSGWCGMAKLLAVMPWNRSFRTTDASQRAQSAVAE